MIRGAFAASRQYFRQKRYLVIQDLVEIESLSGMILDLGGGPASFFAAMFPRAEQIVLADVDFDLVVQAKHKQPVLNIVIADGERLPLADGSVDLTVCNSVVEHVDNPEALATEIRRVSRRYFLQTPNGDFPLETHSFVGMPFYNLIPWKWLKRFVCKVFGANLEYVSSVRYLTERRLRSLFPEANIAYEKVFGLKKSYYVYHTGQNVR